MYPALHTHHPQCTPSSLYTSSLLQTQLRVDAYAEMPFQVIAAQVVFYDELVKLPGFGYRRSVS
jgi:hypothetical protein